MINKIKLPVFTMIILWWFSLFVFSLALIHFTPLKFNLKNYFLCYAFLVAITGIFADTIVIANKPFPKKELILDEFPEEWNTKIPILNFLNLGKMCQKVYELYSIGNKNYQDTHNWTWNYELPHVYGNIIYILAFIFLFLNEKKSFYISLLFGSLILTIDYTVYILHVIYEIMNGIHNDTKFINKFISWGTLDIPYMFFAGYYILWYSYTSLKN